MFTKWTFWKQLCISLIWQTPLIYGLLALFIRVDTGAWNWHLRTWSINYYIIGAFVLALANFDGARTVRERELRKEMDEIREKLRKEVR